MITSWFKINLGDAMLADEALSQMKVFLSNVYEADGRTEGMLALYRHESAGLHCSVVVYLTTEFQKIARVKDALSCDVPPLSDSGFLAGDRALKDESKKENTR